MLKNIYIGWLIVFLIAVFVLCIPVGIALCFSNVFFAAYYLYFAVTHIWCIAIACFVGAVLEDCGGRALRIFRK